MKKTKIIATIGPSCNSSEKLNELLNAGVDVFRINMSHEYNIGNFRKTVERIRNISKKIQIHTAIMQDLSGPKIRVRESLTKSVIAIDKDKIYTIGFGDFDIPMNMNPEFNSDKPSGEIKIDDGSISFSVINCSKDHLTVKALNSGKILPGKGINFPGVPLNLSSITEKDKQDIQIGLEMDVDWIAVSFIQTANDYSVVKSIINKAGKTTPVIAKIEKPEAMQNLDEIIDVFDGILVARGDLGVEMHINKLPVLQKQIVNLCLVKSKPVIVATQMLESMIYNPVPTRAEVNDIANAIYDRADAVMLSGETAVGSYPLEAVKIKDGICETVEKDFDSINFNLVPTKQKINSRNNVESICHAAMVVADDLGIENIVVMTESGTTARTIAQYRPHSKIIALCPFPEICRRLTLIWGIIPVLVDNYKTADEILFNSSKIVREAGFLNKGDLYILTAGLPVGIPGTTNLLKVHRA